jgi:hypothetical protein
MRSRPWRRAEGVVRCAAAHQGRDCNGEVRDGGGVAAVAEVDDPRDVALVVEEHVAEVHIAVDDLCRQRRPARDDVLLVAVEHRLDEPAPVAEVLEVLAELRSVLEIPEQLAARRRVEEAAERAGEARMRDPVRAHGSVREIRAAVPSRQVLEQTHDVSPVHR